MPAASPPPGIPGGPLADGPLPPSQALQWAILTVIDIAIAIAIAIVIRISRGQFWFAIRIPPLAWNGKIRDIRDDM